MSVYMLFSGFPVKLFKPGVCFIARDNVYMRLIIMSLFDLYLSF